MATKPSKVKAYRQHRHKAAPGEVGSLLQELAILDELRTMQLECRRPPEQLARLHVVVRALVVDSPIPSKEHDFGF